MTPRLTRLVRPSSTARRLRQSVKRRLHLYELNDLRPLMPLQLHDLYQACDLWTESPEEVTASTGSAVDEQFAFEYRDVSTALHLRAAEVPLRYPTYFDVAPRTERLLFHLVRANRPLVVVETGIANGRSAAIILAAMDLNGVGTLHSVDIADDVGALVPDRHPRWVTHVGDGTAAALERVLQKAGPVDIFLHDSDHSYRAQRAEYECAERYGSERFILASDDVNWSNAFLDHCTTRGLEMAVLSDVNKCFGVAWRPSRSAPT